MNGVRGGGTYVIRAGSEIPPGWERLLEAIFLEVVIVVCSLEMVVVDRSTMPIRLLKGEVIHEGQ